MSKETKNISEEISKEVSAEETVSTENKKERKSLFASRKFRYGSTATIFTIVVIVAAILLNIVVGVLDEKFPLNLDLTNNKILTLSKECTDYAKQIKDDIKITICSDENSFSSPNTGVKEMDGVLQQYYYAIQQYKKLSKGKVTYKFVDLTTDVTASAELTQYNLSTGSILYQCGKRYSVSAITDLCSYDENFNTYMQYMNYGQKYEGEYSFNSLVEKSLVLNINKITGASLKPVTILTGHDEDQDLISTLTTLFENNGYEVKTTDITTVEKWDESSNFAVIPAPLTDYSSEELKTLRDWTLNDGKYDHQLMYVIDYTKFLPNLAEFFNDNYGIEPTANWVVETSSSRLFNFYVQYTYGDVADTDYTSSSDKWVKSPVTYQLINHWTDNAEESKYNKSVITFPETAQLLDVNAYTEYSKAQEKGEEYDLKQENADSYPITGMAYSVHAQTVDGKTVYSNALVCGSSMYFTGYLNDSATSNEDTFMSVFNGLAGNENNVAIASKSMVTASFDFGSEAAKKGLGLGLFTIGLPLCLLVICFVVFLRRKNL